MELLEDIQEMIKHRHTAHLGHEKKHDKFSALEKIINVIETA